MANQQVAAAVVVMFLVLISPPSSSSARLLNGFSDAATESTLDLALPSDRVVVPLVPEKEDPSIGHVSAPPCQPHHHMGVAGKLPFLGTRLAGGKYGPLILNMFPKGSVPPSGPSRRTNNVTN